MKLKLKIIIFVGLLIVIVAGINFWPGKKAPEIDESKISDSSIIDYQSEFNYLQTVNDCGPYNVAAVVRSLTKEEVSSVEFAKNIGWRMPNAYTLPLGLEKQLKDNDIKIEIPNLKTLSDGDRIVFLRERLSQGMPVIILGERDKIEHYITIFGFNSKKDEFYVYDSLLGKGKEGFTVDENDSLPGNRNFTSEELIYFWRGGGMHGKFIWYAIVASK